MNGSETRIFVDSNIWLYAFLGGEDLHKNEIAQQCIESASENIVISTQVINEVCSNLVRKRIVDETKIRDLVSSFYRRYEVIGISETILEEASHLRQRYSLSYWDSLIVAAALEAGATQLYSEDMQANQRFLDQLQIINPFVI